MHPGTVLATLWRDDRPDIIHAGHAALLDTDGSTLHAWGQPTEPTYWRSATKPFQALAAHRTGAWGAYNLDNEALALACGSHAGETAHVAVARRTLAAAGLDEDALLCGKHRPWSRHSERPGQTPIHNNCSGKHAAMLAACHHKGWDIPSYQKPDHPLQGAIEDILREATGHGDLPTGRDGCGVPTWFLPLVDLAKAFTWLNTHGTQVLDAVGAHPLMISGTGQFCTDLAAATAGQVIGKYGALGVYGAVHRPTGQSLAVKLSAGDEKACKAIAATIMAEAGWLTEDALEALQMHMAPVNKNNIGETVGALRVSLDARP